MLTTVGGEVGAFIYRVDPKTHGLLGLWTSSAHPGTGREILARH